MLVHELGLSELTAGVLVRRGYANPDAARTFLAAAPPGHDPFLLGDMAKAVETIRAAIAAGKRICVHGDYDVDGICATALALLCLRSLGADAEWHLPSRFDEGYGLSGETLDRLAADGCGLVLTVDCGITAVDEIAAARRSADWTSSSPTTTGRASGCPTAPSWRRGRPTTRSRSCAGPASSRSSPRRSGCPSRSTRI